VAKVSQEYQSIYDLARLNYDESMSRYTMLANLCLDWLLLLR